MFSKRIFPIALLLVAALAGTFSLTAIPDRDRESLPTPGELVGEEAARAIADEVALGRVASGARIASDSVSASDSAGSWEIAGRVRLGTSRSLPDAPLVVSLFAGFEAAGEALVEARIRSDEHGNFSWSTIDPQETVTVQVMPELTGYKVWPATRVALLGDPPPSGLEASACLLDTRIVGRVLDSEQQGIAGALVFSHLSEVRSDQQGRYCLEMGSSYRAPVFRVLASGYACEQFAVGELQPGEVRGPDVVLRAELALQGRVVGTDGAPIVDATVCSYPFDRLRTTTTADGRFDWEDSIRRKIA